MPQVDVYALELCFGTSQTKRNPTWHVVTNRRSFKVDSGSLELFRKLYSLNRNSGSVEMLFILDILQTSKSHPMSHHKSQCVSGFACCGLLRKPWHLQFLSSDRTLCKLPASAELSCNKLSCSCLEIPSCICKEPTLTSTGISARQRGKCVSDITLKALM